MTDLKNFDSPHKDLILMIRNFPEEAGVYIMKNGKKKPVYVGKAKNLKKRVLSYFSGTQDKKTTALIQNVVTIDHIVTNSEYEALLLENNFIKKWKPKYNINLKDGKTYPVIKITNEEFPRIYRTRRIVSDGSLYFGPYTSIQSIDRYLELIEKLFPLRKCRGKLKRREHPCLYYHIDRCSAPCTGNINQEDYLKNVEKIKQLLSGNPEELLSDLKEKMVEFSGRMEFEKAAEYRDLMNAIIQVEEEQRVMDFNLDTRDYVGYYAEENKCSFVVLQMRGGKMVGSDIFHSKVHSNEKEALTQFCLQYYSTYRKPPALVFIEQKGDSDAISKYFQTELLCDAEVRIPQDNKDVSLLKMAMDNADEDFRRRKKGEGKVDDLQELKNVLKLKTAPMRIEGFDIAQLDGKYPVASMVSFYRGIPDKSEYRRFHIKGLAGKIDDFEAMREAAARRYTRLLNEKSVLPDLILIDGGIGQVNAVKEVLDSLELDFVPVLGLAKKNEEIYLPHTSKPVILPDGSAPLKILQAVRDEAHRFATTFNKQLRKKEVGFTVLESIPGIGPQRSRMLMSRFGSVQGILSGTEEEIAAAAKLNIELAAEVKKILFTKKF